jgi:hypothetical protein
LLSRISSFAPLYLEGEAIKKRLLGKLNHERHECTGRKKSRGKPS